YVLRGDDLSNLFNLKIANQWEAAETYRISLEAPDSPLKIGSPKETPAVSPGKEITFPVLLTGKVSDAGRGVRIVIEGNDSKATHVVKRVFSGPGTVTE